MNRLTALVLIGASVVFLGCKKGDKVPAATAPAQQEAAASDAAPAAAVKGTLVNDNEYQINGKTFTCKGNFSPETYQPDASGMVTFTAFPASYEEFADLYENFLGKTPEGTAAMATMAMELYFRDAAVGEKCVDLLCGGGCAAEMKRGVGEKARSCAKGDSYGQRYLPAAVLKGANSDNGYLPQEPYTIELKASVNKHEKVQISDSGTCLFLYVMGDGWDSHQRSVQVFLPDGQDHYKMWSASSLYMQCKNTSKPFKELK